MKTTMQYIKFFIVFIMTTLFSSHVYGVDIKLDADAGILKIAGEISSQSSCREGDYYYLKNTSTFKGRAFDILLHIAKSHNNVASDLAFEEGSGLEKCIDIVKSEDKKSALITIALKSTYVPHEESNKDEILDLNDNSLSYMDLEFIPIEKVNNPSDINIHNLKVMRLDSLGMTLFDMDRYNAQKSYNTTGKDSVYIAHPGSGLIPDGSKVTVEKHHDSTGYNFGNYDAILGASSSCSRNDLKCRAYANVMANNEKKFLFRVLNKNACEAYVTGYQYRKTMISLDKAFFLKSTVQSISDANVTEGEVLRHIVEVNASDLVETYELNVTDITTTAGEDYNDQNITVEGTGVTLENGIITVQPGTTNFTVVVSSNEDPDHVLEETYTITVSNSKGAKMGKGVIRETGDEPVNNIKDARVFEGDSLTHDVFFANPLLKATEYSYSVQEEDATKLIRGASVGNGSDYNPDEPTFTKGVTYNPQTKMIKVPAGVQTFSIMIESFEDLNLQEEGENYTITVGGKTAKGRVLNIDS